MPILRNPHRERFTVIENRIFDDGLSLEAVGLWTYLMSKPDGWQINKQHIMEKFEIGRDKCARLFRELRDAGYMSSHRPRDKKTGTLQGEELVLNESPEHGRNPPDDGKPGSRVSREPDKPAAGFSDPLVNTDGLEKTEGEEKTDSSQQLAIPDTRPVERPEDIEMFIGWVRRTYPKRDGGQRWADAERAIRKRWKEGHSLKTMAHGVQRYGRWANARGIVKTPMVQQAATFFGRNKGFLEDWEIHHEASGRDGSGGLADRAASGL